jgi:hypothetical protein
MTKLDTSNEPAPTRLSVLSRTLLFISIVLAGFLFGTGFETFMDEGSNWLQIMNVVAPALLTACVGYVLVESRTC